jgi:hypothetical protein
MAAFQDSLGDSRAFRPPQSPPAHLITGCLAATGLALEAGHHMNGELVLVTFRSVATKGALIEAGDES